MSPTCSILDNRFLVVDMQTLEVLFLLSPHLSFGLPGDLLILKNGSNIPLRKVKVVISGKYLIQYKKTAEDGMTKYKSWSN